MVYQYQCEYCGKKNYSSFHMNWHEQHCTMNPIRKCGMCEKLKGRGPCLTVPEMVELLPNIKQFEKQFQDNDGLNFGPYVSWPGIDKAVEEKMQNLRDAVDNCPACILAALRQAGIKRYMIPNIFDYKKEKEQMWADYNESQMESRYY
jgi:ferredoxin